MRTWVIRSAICAIFVVAPQVVAAQQRTSTNRVDANTDWSVFVDGNPKECWAVSAPRETVNTRGGTVVAVRRGDILMFVTYRPAAGVKGEVSFTGGYPFAEGTTVALEIGSTKFELFTDGEWAYPATPEDDARIITTMRGGSEAVLVGRSGRGTLTTDKFSLLGFTASVEEATKRCFGD